MLKGPASLSLLALIFSQAEALDNGLLTKPWLGFNTYNAVSCSPTDAFIRSSADVLKSQGFLDLGYQYVQLDCGYQAQQRTAAGSLTHEPSRFPNGIKALADYVKSKGFKWAMYSDAGVKACDTTRTPPPGSLGNEKIDAQYFLDNGAELLKYDNCYVTADRNAPKDPDSSFVSRYGAMHDAINSLGAGNKLPMTTCQWGVPYISPSGALQGPDQWTPQLANGYRLSDDIAAGWTSILQIYNQAIHLMLKGASAPGRWADADMLQVGNNVLSSAEEESHFAYWAMIKSPLMISTNLTTATDHTKSVLKNKGLISINQDPAGKPISLVQRWSNDRDLFSGSLSNGEVAVLLVDHSNQQKTRKIDFSKELNISSADYVDLFTGAKGSGVSSFSKTVPAHGPIALKLSNVKTANSSPKVTYSEAESAVVAGDASVANCSGCSNGKKVGNLGSGASVTFNLVPTSTTATLLIDYINAEVQYSFANQINVRGAKVSVNGGNPLQVLFPLTGYNWDVDVLKNFRLELTGLKAGESNSIKFEADPSVSQYAPDFDRVGIVA